MQLHKIVYEYLIAGAKYSLDSSHNSTAESLIADSKITMPQFKISY